jgi:glycosyltransferase involved in cell wall biosynthesis
MTSIEAFAVGTPVIVNNLGALPEVVEASGGGIIYNSPAEMGAAIDRLGADRGLRDELGRRGREAYLKYWTAERHLEQYFELIAGLRHGRSNPDLPLD